MTTPSDETTSHVPLESEMAAAEFFAEECGLTLGTMQAGAVITGFLAGVAHARQNPVKTCTVGDVGPEVAGLLAALEEAAEFDRTDDCNGMAGEIARKALAQFKGERG